VIPTAVSIINHQIDVSYVFSLAEEENKKSKEVELYSETKIYPLYSGDIFVQSFVEYGNQLIKAVYLSLIPPPPKLLLSL